MNLAYKIEHTSLSADVSEGLNFSPERPGHRMGIALDPIVLQGLQQFGINIRAEPAANL